MFVAIKNIYKFSKEQFRLSRIQRRQKRIDIMCLKYMDILKEKYGRDYVCDIPEEIRDKYTFCLEVVSRRYTYYSDSPEIDYLENKINEYFSEN